jgi:hypothetical protein
MQGLCSDRLQTVVHCINYNNSDKIAETAVREESAIVSKQDRYKGEGSNPNKCGRCGKLGHGSRERKDVHVN